MNTIETRGHSRTPWGVSLIVSLALCTIAPAGAPSAESAPKSGLIAGVPERPVFRGGGDPAGSARNPGAVGAVYPIAEPDALSEIEERARRVDWEKVIGRKIVEKKVSGYRPAGLVPLARVEKGRRYTVDLTYTLSEDIPDGKGGTLYPKGYAFNPLDYVTLPNTLVVLDGADEAQVNWFYNSEHFDDFKTILLITGGAYSELSRRLNRPVYYADGAIIDRFDLAATPAVVRQRGKNMEAQEIAVQKPS